MSGTTGDNENPFLNLPTFNPDNFLLDTEALTIEDGDDRYIKLSGGSVNGLLTCSTLAVTDTLTVDGVEITTSEYLTGITPGTATASKALVLDASKDIGTIREISSQKINFPVEGYTNTPINILDSTLSTSSLNISFGQSAATNNQGFLYFYYDSNGSASNYIGLSLYGSSNTLKVFDNYVLLPISYYQKPELVKLVLNYKEYEKQKTKTINIKVIDGEYKNRWNKTHPTKVNCIYGPKKIAGTYTNQPRLKGYNKST